MLLLLGCVLFCSTQQAKAVDKSILREVPSEEEIYGFAIKQWEVSNAKSRSATD
jgi:hypothetical protein